MKLSMLHEGSLDLKFMNYYCGRCQRTTRHKRDPMNPNKWECTECMTPKASVRSGEKAERMSTVKSPGFPIVLT